MRITKTLRPGQKGTKELLSRFGRSLLCVRYRYDEDSQEHLKTVELVVQRRSRDGNASCDGSRKAESRDQCVAGRKVALRIGWRERDLQRRVKSGGGQWDPDRRVWIVGREVVERLDLLSRVVGGGGR